MNEEQRLVQKKCVCWSSTGQAYTREETLIRLEYDGRPFIYEEREMRFVYEAVGLSTKVYIRGIKEEGWCLTAEFPEESPNRFMNVVSVDRSGIDLNAVYPPPYAKVFQ